MATPTTALATTTTDAPDAAIGATGTASGWRHELALSVELAALAVFAFSRPVLGSFGESPETFVVSGATGWVVVAFGVAVTLIPAVVVGLVGLAVRRLGGRARPWTQPVLVGILGGVVVWRVGQEIMGWPGNATKLLLAGPLAGVLFLVLRRRVPGTATFLRYAGACSVVFLGQFLFASPASSLVFGDGSQLDSDVVADVGAQLGDDPPDILFLAFDALPVESLLDGTGHIDAELFPNFAAVAGDGTWYRNHTTVSAFTHDAIPALVTGRYPATNSENQRADEENLFTLLGGSYDMHVREQITRLCPEEACPQPRPGGLTPLLGEAVDLWKAGVVKGEDDTEFDLPGLFAGRVYGEAEEWVDGLRLRSGGRPDLVFHHLIMPHEPWRTTDDGTYYDGGNPPTGYYVNTWTRTGIEVGRQRHILQLQAADRLLGQHLDALREAGMYDDALVVVTADHGAAFLPDQPSRGVTTENFAHIMWTPLIVKAPGTSGPHLDDTDVRSVDVLPTVADILGVELPWSVDGEVIGTADRDGRTKPLDDSKRNHWRSEDGDDLIDVAVGDSFEQVMAADPVPWTGPDAVWRRTEHGALFGLSVDDLTVGEPTDDVIRIDALDDLDDISLDDPLPLEVVGLTDMADGTVVAYALNGTIGVVGTVEEGDWPGNNLINGIVPPRLFEEGRNELTAYVVEGEPGSETLRPLSLERD
jgi:hypothetical protein